MHTCVFSACTSGKLFKAVMNLDNSKETKHFLRKRTLIVFLLAWANLVSYIFGDIHGYFWSNDFDNSTLTPLLTLILPDRNTTVFAMKVICFLIQSYANANIVLLIAFHLLLTMTIAREFSLLNDRFKTDIRTAIRSRLMSVVLAISSFSISCLLKGFDRLTTILAASTVQWFCARWDS